MPRAIPLGRQIMGIVRVRRDFQRQAFRNSDPLGLQSCNLFGIIRKQSYRRHAQKLEHLCRHRKVAGINGKAQPDIRIDSAKSVVLQGIGAQLVDEANAAAFLPQVEQYAPLRVGYLV